MTGRLLASIAAGVIAVLAVCAGLTTALFFGGAPALGCDNTAAAPATAAPSSFAVGPVTVGRWDAEQTGHASTIIAVGTRKNVPPRGWVIALATAMQESNLRNLGDLGPDNDHDSLGLFQQRPSQGWGTPAQVMDPAYSSGKFYDKLLQVAHWQELPVTVAAQAVQRSAFPDAYAKWESDAQQLLNALARSAAIGTSCGAIIGPAGWTQPVRAEIVSGFGERDGRLHAGVDFSVGKRTPIHAAASGIVLQVTCNAHTADGAPYSCDRDGSTSIGGCGWYVDIEHADKVITRYCHMLVHPYVQIGQQVAASQIIGISGTSGHSSGPHLHYEVHLGGDRSNNGAIDPVPWMAAHGAPIGHF